MLNAGNRRHGSGRLAGGAQQIEKLGIVNDFGPRWIGEPLAHDRERSVFNVVSDKVRRSWFGRNFDAQHTRAEALVVGLFGFERKPDGRFLASRDSIEKFFERRGRIKRGIIGGALVDHRSKFLNERRKIEFGIKLAQRD